jgi:hypothetical protein
MLGWEQTNYVLLVCGRKESRLVWQIVSEVGPKQQSWFQVWRSPVLEGRLRRDAEDRLQDSNEQLTRLKCSCNTNSSEIVREVV